MDLEAGDTTGRDELRSFMRAGTDVTDAELQHAWDTMCDHAPEEVSDEYLIECPPSVIEWAYTVAAALWRARDQAGGVQPSVDDTFGPGQTPTVVTLRRTRAILPQRYARSRAVVAGQ